MLWTLLLVFIGTYIIPVLVTLLMYRLKMISSIEMKQARDRRFPYLVGALSYYFVSEVIKGLNIPRETHLFLLASTAVILLHLLLLRRFKPSAHMAGIGGFLGLLFALALHYRLNLIPLLALAIILAGLLASARLFLKAHNNFEVVFGFFSGLGLVFLILYFF